MGFSRQEYRSGLLFPSPGDSDLLQTFKVLASGVGHWGLYYYYVLAGRPVLMWELDYKESWVPKNDAFELWFWRRLLRVPCTARRSNQSILKEIIPDYSLEGLRLKLKLQYFGHLMWRTDSLEKILMLGKIEGGRTRGRQRLRWLDGITYSKDMSLNNLWKLLIDREALHAAIHLVTKSQTSLRDCTELKFCAILHDEDKLVNWG